MSRPHFVFVGGTKDEVARCSLAVAARVPVTSARFNILPRDTAAFGACLFSNHVFFACATDTASQGWVTASLAEACVTDAPVVAVKFSPADEPPEVRSQFPRAWCP